MKGLMEWDSDLTSWDKRDKKGWKEEIKKSDMQCQD